MMEVVIKALTPDLEEDYFDFFDNRAFSDGSPFYPCYCSAFNMSSEQIKIDFFEKAELYGGGQENWKKALRECAVRMVKSGLIKGYLAFINGEAIGWCNANDRTNYYRVGEFNLDNVPENENNINCLKKGEIKSIVCFEIAPEYRGMGIASKLLDRVCLDAKNDGYEFIEAYPTVREQHNNLAFTGPVHIYEKAGFTHFMVKETTIIMRKKLR